MIKTRLALLALVAAASLSLAARPVAADPQPPDDVTATETLSPNDAPQERLIGAACIYGQIVYYWDDGTATSGGYTVECAILNLAFGPVVAV